jgi:hypothetical protein
MAGNVNYDLCSETGVACVMVNQDVGLLKIDLMPDEAVSLRKLIQSGDKAGAKALLESIDPQAVIALDDAVLDALALEIY